MTLKIGILQADDVLPVLAEKYGEYPSMFKQLLTTANGDSSMGVEFVTYAVNAGVYPCGN